MANEKPAPQIFLSYSWANTDIADTIDNDFKSIGISFLRDIRDVGYRTSIKEFMQRIGKSDFVVMLISDEYLRSENCMYEVSELLNSYEFEKRILPVLLNNAKHVFKSIERKPYYDHWKQRQKMITALLTEHPNTDYTEQKRKIDNINSYIDLFFTKITDLNVLTFDTLKTQNYKPMIDIIGFEEKALLQQVLEIGKIKDIEEQELAFETFIGKYPQNKYALFHRAYSAEDNKRYQKARKYYTDLLLIYPQNADAHNNLGRLFMINFSNYSAAKEHYEKAIQINPQYEAAYYNLGCLFMEHFSDYTAAQKQYEKAIRINPQFAIAYYNLGILFANYFSDYITAKRHFEKAIQINPQYVKAHYNLGVLLMNHFSDYPAAKVHYEKAIQISPQYAEAHYNLGVLLMNHFSDYPAAKVHYEKAIQVNPQYAKAHLNLCILR